MTAATKRKPPAAAPNYEASHVEAACKDLEAAQLPGTLMIDFSHANSSKQHEKQLEGEFVAIRESTAEMSKARSSSLIEYSLAFCAAHEINCQEHA